MATLEPADGINPVFLPVMASGPCTPVRCQLWHLVKHCSPALLYRFGEIVPADSCDLTIRPIYVSYYWFIPTVPRSFPFILRCTTTHMVDISFHKTHSLKIGAAVFQAAPLLFLSYTLSLFLVSFSVQFQCRQCLPVQRKYFFCINVIVHDVRHTVPL